jgi:hypothetical protein
MKERKKKEATEKEEKRRKRQTKTCTRQLRGNNRALFEDDKRCQIELGPRFKSLGWSESI